MLDLGALGLVVALQRVEVDGVGVQREVVGTAWLRLAAAAGAAPAGGVFFITAAGRSHHGQGDQHGQHHQQAAYS